MQVRYTPTIFSNALLIVSVLEHNIISNRVNAKTITQIVDGKFAMVNGIVNSIETFGGEP